jgi:hypothetical protein
MQLAHIKSMNISMYFVEMLLQHVQIDPHLPCFSGGSMAILLAYFVVCWTFGYTVIGFPMYNRNPHGI